MSGPTGPAPLHLLAGGPRHGVTRCARNLATATGAPVLLATLGHPAGSTWLHGTWLDGTGLDSTYELPDAVHLHVTDRILADTPAGAAAVVERLAQRARLTLTVHDVPQHTDGAGFPARRDAYTRMLAAAHGWVTSSEHEQGLLVEHCGADGGHVVPLALVGPDPLPEARTMVAGPTIGLFGHVYPGKGHREAIEAAAIVRARGTDVSVVIVGGAAAGHERVEDDLRALAADLAVPLHLTGFLPDDAATAVLRGVDVGLTGHRNLSASGSINSWVAAGRRPLVRDSPYVRELERLRPGSHLVYRDEHLVDVLQHALAHPEQTHLDPGSRPGPDLADVARRYLAWWAGHR